MTDTISSAVPLGKDRIQYIDGMRAIAALSVMLGHAYSISLDGSHASPSPLAGYIHYAVTAFICLSGFSLFLSIAKNDGKMKTGTVAFYLSRARRILPPYFAAFALAVFVDFRLGNEPLSLFIASIVNHLALVTDWTQDGMMIIPPLWSVAVEWHIYFFLPLIVFCFARFGLAKTLIGAVAAAVIIGDVLDKSSMYTYYYALFVIAGAAAIVGYQKTDIYFNLRKIRWPLVSALMLAIWMISTVLNLNSWCWDFVFGLSVCALLLSLALGQTKPRILAWNPLVWIGGWSYSLYLVHWPILIVMHHSKQANYVESIAVAFVSAYLFHLIFEMPFMSKSKTMAKRLTAVLSPTPSQNTAPSVLAEA